MKSPRVTTCDKIVFEYDFENVKSDVILVDFVDDDVVILFEIEGGCQAG